MVEQKIDNFQVVGSSPISPTSIMRDTKKDNAAEHGLTFSNIDRMRTEGQKQEENLLRWIDSTTNLDADKILDTMRTYGLDDTAVVTIIKLLFPPKIFDTAAKG